MQQVQKGSIFSEEFKILEENVSEYEIHKLKLKLFLRRIDIAFYVTTLMILILLLSIAVLKQLSLESILNSLHVFIIIVLAVLIYKRDKVYLRYQKSVSDYFKLVFKSQAIDKFKSVYFSKSGFINIKEFVDSGLLSFNGLDITKLDIKQGNHFGFIIDDTKIELNNVYCQLQDTKRVHFKGVLLKMTLSSKFSNDILFIPEPSTEVSKYSAQSIKCGEWYYNDKYDINLLNDNRSFLENLVVMSNNGEVNYDSLDNFSLYIFSAVLNKYPNSGISIQDNIVYVAYRTDDVFTKDEYMNKEKFNKLTAVLSDLLIIKGRVNIISNKEINT